LTISTKQPGVDLGWKQNGKQHYSWGRRCLVTGEMMPNQDIENSRTRRREER